MIEIAFKKTTAIDVTFRFAQSYQQTFFRDRSHQVAEGVSIKCFHWIVAWGYHENSRHQGLGTKYLAQFKAVQADHLDVKEHKRRAMLDGCLYGVFAGNTLGHQANPCVCDKQRAEILAGRNIGVGDQSATAHT